MTTKGDRINLRVTDEQRLRWEEAAKKDRRALADWIRIQLDDAADRALAAASGPKGTAAGKTPRGT